MTIKEAVSWGKNRLLEAGIDNADYDSFELMSAINGMTKTFYFINGNSDISEEVLPQYQENIERRASHIPLQHILGKAYFYGLEFEVNENVLIPRQDTEVLVETVSKLDMQEAEILDMCTGSGCIAISLAHLLKDSTVLGVDISDKALEVASRNKIKLEAENVSFLKSNLFADLGSSYEYDCIVSNPPYIPTKVIEGLQEEVRLHDPMLALDGSEDGLKFYREITRDSVGFLKDNGWLCYEIGAEQGKAVSEIMARYGFSQIQVIKDLAGLDRVVIGRKIV